MKGGKDTCQGGLLNQITHNEDDNELLIHLQILAVHFKSQEEMIACLPSSVSRLTDRLIVDQKIVQRFTQGFRLILIGLSLMFGELEASFDIKS